MAALATCEEATVAPIIRSARLLPRWTGALVRLLETSERARSRCNGLLCVANLGAHSFPLPSYLRLVPLHFLRYASCQLQNAHSRYST